MRLRGETGYNSDLVSNDYRDSKIEFNHKNSLNAKVGIDETLQNSSSIQDLDSFNSNVKRNCIGNSFSKTSPHVKNFNPNQILVDNEMGIDWDRLKLIPFGGRNNCDILSCPNTSNLGSYNTIPYVDSKIEWWELDNDNAVSLSSESLVTSECSSKFSNFPCCEGMDTGSDSGVSSMVC